MLRGSSGGLSLAVFHLNSKKQKLYRLAPSTVDADREDTVRPAEACGPGRNGSLGDVNPSMRGYAVDTRSSLRGFLGHRLEDQIANFSGH